MLGLQLLPFYLLSALLTRPPGVSVFLGYYPVLVSLFTWAMAGEQAGGALRHWETGSRGQTYLGEEEYNPHCFLANSHTKLLQWKAPER